MRAMNLGKLCISILLTCLLAAACRQAGDTQQHSDANGNTSAQVEQRNTRPYASDITLQERIDDITPGDEGLPRLENSSVQGRGNCFSCHKELVVGYRQTAHDLSNSPMEAMFVKGDFSDAEYSDELGSARFSRDAERYIINIAVPGGSARDYEVVWCIGGQSVQQYALRMDDGRIQVPDIGWDVEAQRWFRLPETGVHEASGGRDWLGWNANWSTNCARCHSSGVQRVYDNDTLKFETYLGEDDVTCEACHGGAKFHIGWAEGERQGLEAKVARKGLVFYLTGEDHEWRMDHSRGTAYRSPRRTERREIETCMQCHSLSEPLVDSFGFDRDPLNYLDIALLREGLYHPDGQIADVQVYEGGSFLQSREYLYGVSCADCHDPHTGRTWEDGNALCLRCHSAERFDVQEHHFHPAGSEGSQCISCHMATQDYLGVDSRHDHSFRIPRPDLTRSIGTPNACSSCHADMPLEDVIASFTDWYGDDRPQHFGELFAQARSGDAASIPGLEELATDELAAPIVRATAYEELGRFASSGSEQTIRRGLAAENSLIRLAAVRAAGRYPADTRMEMLLPLLDDKLQSVSLELGRLLADTPASQLDGEQLRKLNNCVDKYITSQQSRPWLAESYARIGWVLAMRGMSDESADAFEEMRRREPLTAECYLLEARAMRQAGRRQKAEELLQAGLAAFPEDAELATELAQLGSPVNGKDGE